MNTRNKVIRPSDDYFIARLESLYDEGEPPYAMNAEFDQYEVPFEERRRFMMASPYYQTPEIRGAVELFGHRIGT